MTKDAAQRRSWTFYEAINIDFEISPIPSAGGRYDPQDRWVGQEGLAYVDEGDKLWTQLAGLKKLARYQPIDTVSLKRMFADRIIDLEAYQFSIGLNPLI